ncbi:hypothetical protein [Geodermatophilus sp. SYSU D01105]
MNLHVHIQRLVLEDPTADLDHAAVARAVEGELARLLHHTPLAPDLTARAVVPALRGGDLGAPAAHPEALGHQIAAAVHAGLAGGSRPPTTPGGAGPRAPGRTAP